MKMKTDAECAEYVLKWSQDSLLRATGELIKLQCEIHGKEQSKKMWDDYNVEDAVGCFSQNPYNVSKYDLDRLAELAKNKVDCGNVLIFVTKRICQQIKD